MASISLDSIRLDGGTQPRGKIDYLLVREYQELYSSGVEFPPVVVFYDGSEYWLADGFHRVSAYPVTGKEKIEAELIQGTREDAVWYSCGANAIHGERRTNEDKRRAVITALQHPKSKGLSDRAIAEHCGVSHPFVAEVRRQLETVTSSTQPRVGKDGKSRPARNSASQREREKKDNKRRAGSAGGKAKAANAKKAKQTKETSSQDDGGAAQDDPEESPSYDEVSAAAIRLAELMSHLTAQQQDSILRLIQTRLKRAA